MVKFEDEDLAGYLVLVQRATKADKVRYLTQEKFAEWVKESMYQVRQILKGLVKREYLIPRGQWGAGVYKVTPKGEKFVNKVRTRKPERKPLFGTTDPLKYYDELPMPNWKSKNKLKADDALVIYYAGLDSMSDRD